MPGVNNPNAVDVGPFQELVSIRFKNFGGIYLNDSSIPEREPGWGFLKRSPEYLSLDKFQDRRIRGKTSGSIQPIDVSNWGIIHFRQTLLPPGGFNQDFNVYYDHLERRIFEINRTAYSTGQLGLELGILQEELGIDPDSHYARFTLAIQSNFSGSVAKNFISGPTFTGTNGDGNSEFTYVFTLTPVVGLVQGSIEASFYGLPSDIDFQCLMGYTDGITTQDVNVFLLDPITDEFQLFIQFGDDPDANFTGEIWVRNGEAPDANGLVSIWEVEHRKILGQTIASKFVPDFTSIDQPIFTRSNLINNTFNPALEVAWVEEEFLSLID